MTTTTRRPRKSDAVWRTSRRLDARRLKEEQPALYDEYAVTGGNWTLTREDR